VQDEDGRGVPNTLLEIWQANACGRYIHVRDQNPAPLDPNFTGAGRAQSDAEGYYRFVTVKPGAYPWAIITTPGGPPISISRYLATPSSPGW
jgi:protocatechuate 3,4-dioxygenase beta subunit